MSNSPGLIQRFIRPFRVNEVRTDRDGAYPEIEPRIYDASRESVFEAVESVIEERERWDLVGSDLEAGELSAEVETKWAGFVDDLDVRLEAGEDETTVVHAHSRSRIGEGDFGQNARTIRELFEGLDRRLERVEA